jgi:glycosyltransferase involved in cell wall biosynthesis
MKLLFIAAPFPYPPDTGSKNLIYHWLDAASRTHSVDLLIFEESSGIKRTIPELPQLNIDIYPVVIGRSGPERISRLVSAATRRIPSTSLIYMSPDAVQHALRRVRETHYDAVVLTENVVSGYARLLAPILPVIVFKHSIQAVDAADARRCAGRAHPRWILEEWIVRKYEAESCAAGTRICCVNTEDAHELARRYCLAAPPAIVPIGVDLSRFPARVADPGGMIIGFYGNMTWGANIDAALWFGNQVLPKVQRKHPNAQFRVIGPGSAHLRSRSRSENIVCVDAVPQEKIAEAMQDVTVGVVPVISGTGVRLKLLEMLSLGIPVVTTPLGSLGTRCRDGEQCLIAPDPESFATAVSRLLSDPALRQKLSRAGMEIAPNHEWKKSYPKIVRVLEEAAGHVVTAPDESIGAQL